MFARVFSGGVVGIDAYCIEVEVDCSGGIGQIQVVGLPDTAVKESQERVRAAIKSCSFFMPSAKKWIVNLAPADIRKEGPSFDLPIAVGILASSGMIPTAHLSALWVTGELGLDGTVRPVAGVLPLALTCKRFGALGIVVPDANAEEASLVENLRIYPVSHLKQVCSILANPESCSYLEANPRAEFSRRQSQRQSELDFKDVKGQHLAKRAFQIAAAGRHNVLLVGPPGSGKSMLAQRLPSIMPPLAFDEAVELTKLYSITGSLSSRSSLVLERPFRNPHHSASSVGLIGGGTIPKPGEISLSHMGILFLDELTEFPKSHLDTLRQPLEASTITITRAHQTLTFPASFLFVGACNPCPCGYRGDQVKHCVCTPGQADRYWAKLSGPLLDRIDLHVRVARLSEEELTDTESGVSSNQMRLEVERAVDIQRQRYDDSSNTFNGQISQKELRKYCLIDDRSRHLLCKAVARLGLSARAYDRILRIARTIADLAAAENISSVHIAEALNYRCLPIN